MQEGIQHISEVNFTTQNEAYEQGFLLNETFELNGCIDLGEDNFIFIDCNVSIL